MIADRASAGAGVEAAGGGGSDFEHAATVSAIKGLKARELRVRSLQEHHTADRATPTNAE